MRGYRAVKQSHLNHQMDTRCKRIRQVAGPPLWRASSEDEVARNGWDSILQRAAKIHRDEFHFSPDQYCSQIQTGVCVHCAVCERVSRQFVFPPVSGVKGQTLKVFFFTGLCLPALEFVCELPNGLLCLPASLPLLVTLFQNSLVQLNRHLKN